HARMARLRGLYHVDREKTDGVDAQLVELVLVHGALLGSTGLCQPPGTAATRRSASSGPHVPGSYGRGGVGRSRTGSTTRHCASMESWRANRLVSPRMASPSSRS